MLLALGYPELSEAVADFNLWKYAMIHQFSLHPLSGVSKMMDAMGFPSGDMNCEITFCSLFYIVVLLLHCSVRRREIRK